MKSHMFLKNPAESLALAGHITFNVDGEVITENLDIARSMNEFFCRVGRNLSVKIPQQPNPLLTGEYKINESTEQPTEFKFHPTINRALGKM